MCLIVDLLVRSSSVMAWHCGDSVPVVMVAPYSDPAIVAQY